MSTVTIELRPARVGDERTIVRFIRALAAYEREPDAATATEEAIRTQLTMEPAPFECLIAERDGAPVGFALYFWTYSTWRAKVGVHLEDLWVEPEARGLGVARLLMEAIAARTVARGGARLEWRVLDWNELALGFYRHIGATDLREWQTCRLDGPALHALAERGATHAPPDDDAGAPADWEDPVAT